MGRRTVTEPDRPASRIAAGDFRTETFYNGLRFSYAGERQRGLAARRDQREEPVDRCLRSLKRCGITRVRCSRVPGKVSLGEVSRAVVQPDADGNHRQSIQDENVKVAIAIDITRAQLNSRRTAVKPEQAWDGCAKMDADFLYITRVVVSDRA